MDNSSFETAKEVIAKRPSSFETSKVSFYFQILIVQHKYVFGSYYLFSIIISVNKVVFDLKFVYMKRM